MNIRNIVQRATEFWTLRTHENYVSFVLKIKWSHFGSGNNYLIN